MLVSSLSLACATGQDVVFLNRWPLFTQFFLVWVCLVRVFFGHGMWIHLFHFLMVIIPFFFWGMSTRGGNIHQWSPPLSQHSQKPSQIVGFSPTASPLNGLLESGISKASINSCTPIQGWFTYMLVCQVRNHRKSMHQVMLVFSWFASQLIYGWSTERPRTNAPCPPKKGWL